MTRFPVHAHVGKNISVKITSFSPSHLIQDFYDEARCRCSNLSLGPISADRNSKQRCTVVPKILLLSYVRKGEEGESCYVLQCEAVDNEVILITQICA